MQLTKKTPEWNDWHHGGVIIVTFEDISHCIVGSSPLAAVMNCFLNIFFKILFKICSMSTSQIVIACCNWLCCLMFEDKLRLEGNI